MAWFYYKWVGKVMPDFKQIILQPSDIEKRGKAGVGTLVKMDLVAQDGEDGVTIAGPGVVRDELHFQKEEKGKRAAELVIANIELAFQNEEKEKRAAELIIANRELLFQNKEKEKRAAELVVANKELLFQNEEKEKRAAELIIANKELAFQNREKENRAAELDVANKELHFQNKEKEKRANELIVANNELVFQNEEKEKRAAELIIANNELAFQNREKEKRAAELVVANKELHFQNEEKEKRAEELIIANRELLFQNEEKEKRAAELIVANKELLFQNAEKEKRAAELIVANKELAYQNEEKEKRAAELVMANNELLAFTYIASHDLQEPLRKIQTFSALILEKEYGDLSPQGKDYFLRMRSAAARMQQLINDLLAYSRINTTERLFEVSDLRAIIEDVASELKETMDEKQATLETGVLCPVSVIPFQFRQLMYNMISNALKFSNPAALPVVKISSIIAMGSSFDYDKLSPDKEYCQITIADNGIGFEPEFCDRIFELFQKLHGREEYAGTGIGLSIVKKIVENHNGIIVATGELNNGARFDIYLPANQKK